MAFNAPDTACVNVNVLFTNQTSCPTCGVLSYEWDFGDGSIGSSLVSPQHAYPDTGTYVVTLIAGSGFGCTDTTTRTIRIIKVPEVAFSFTPDNGCGPLQVTLANNSLGLPINYLWDIETYGTSAAANPGPITFPQAPCDSIYYTIQLSASNQCGTVIAIDSVKVFSVPYPVLLLNTDTICSPDTVQGFNATTCAWQTTYTWLFGDGDTLVSQTPLVSHFYSSDSIPAHLQHHPCRRERVRHRLGHGYPAGDPEHDHSLLQRQPLIGCEPLLVQFTQSMVGITDWAWDFGDGFSSLAQDPSHLFLNDGTYTAELDVSNGCVSDSISQVITVLPGPDFDFVADPDSICAGDTIQFTAFGANLTGYQWSFGDGSVSTQAAPAHEYAQAGVYTVQLICLSTVTLCPDTVQHPVWVLPNPVASFTAAPLEGCTRSGFTSRTRASSQASTIGTLAMATPQASRHHRTSTTPGAYTIELLVTSGNGCVDSTETSVTVHPVPTAAFTFALDTLPDFILPAYFDNLSTGAVSYVWTFGDGQGSNQFEPGHQYAINSTCSYSPMLVVYNEFQCTDTAVG
ncbi:MAG: PKD domain-containing protein [Flavobacteriales bacterium]|nr:PKD domain-containing protein [Flavobacteriales bacterium]